MRKVLIVDDEKYIRAGIRTMIQRLNTQFDTFVECTNGREALEYIMQDKFDLIITDIRMPQMDGLELMKEIQLIDHSIPIIILSGYDDFQYAVEAIKYGAKAYLLKPIDRIELFNILKKIELELSERENLEKKSRYINKLCQNQLHYIFLNDHLKSKEIKEILDNLGIDLFFTPFYVAIFELKLDSEKNNFSTFLKLVEEYIERKQEKTIYFQEPTGDLLLAVNQNFKWNEMLNFIAKNSSQNFVLAVSGLGKSLEDIRKTYLQARQALKYKIFVKRSGILYHQDIDKREKDFVLPYEKIERVFNLVGTGTNIQIQKDLNQILDISLFYKNNINYFEEIVRTLKEKISKNLMLIDNRKREEFQKKYLHVCDPYHFEHIREYCDYIRQYILELNDYIRNFNCSCNNIDYKIDMAIQYIREHYQEDLNLAVVANYVSLNYYYFSHIFKERTGMSFTSFLNKIRIEKSKEFLKDTDDKVIDIAVRVGFQNAKLFTKNFRKITGISPTQYRQRFYSN